MTFQLVRVLLRGFRVFRLVAVSTVLFAMLCQPAAAQTPAFPYRDHAVQLLQKLLATGYPLDNEHDDGEWLQAAVNYAIHAGDREIESLAIRAAVPLRARVSRPVSSTEGPAFIEVLSYKVLTLPRPVSYVAWLEGSLDGSDFVDLGSQVSESPRTVDLRQFGPEGLRPGSALRSTSRRGSSSVIRSNRSARRSVSSRRSPTRCTRSLFRTSTRCPMVRPQPRGIRGERPRTPYFHPSPSYRGSVAWCLLAEKWPIRGCGHPVTARN